MKIFPVVDLSSTSFSLKEDYFMSIIDTGYVYFTKIVNKVELLFINI